VISPVDPCSAWTAKANKRVQFGYGLNYLIDIENAVIVDVEATPARTYDEVAATKVMIKRTDERLGLKPSRLAADTAYGTGKFLSWLIATGITPHIPVWDMSQRHDGTFSRADFTFDEERNVYICPAGKLLATTGKVQGNVAISPGAVKSCLQYGEGSVCSRPSPADRIRVVFCRSMALRMPFFRTKSRRRFCDIQKPMSDPFGLKRFDFDAPKSRNDERARPVVGIHRGFPVGLQVFKVSCDGIRDSERTSFPRGRVNTKDHALPRFGLSLLKVENGDSVRIRKIVSSGDRFHRVVL
jgi:hypothetical protein